jgi:FAD/FMN-containing dehydrogenase
MARHLSDRGDYGSWGGVFAPRHEILAINDRSLPLPQSAGSLLAYGAGRSYGDCCLNDGNALILARGLDRFIGFDETTGVLRCEAGVSLAEIVDFALPRGWFLPVTPGTKHVTLGGAIANDVHGKNHHRDGSLGQHIPRFELLRSDGTRLECSATGNADFHGATLGGLGLTGLITWAEIRLQPVAGPWIRQQAIRFGSLREFFELSGPLEQAHRYVVAWLDCVSPGGPRGVLFAGDHDDRPGPAPRRRLLPFPRTGPVSLVTPFTMRAFNELYYRLPRGRAGEAQRISYDNFFYPLDGITNWSHIYGPRGFFQYQCLVPPDTHGHAALVEILERIAQSGQPSFLAVLKRFGTIPPLGMMSFPRPGFTLALDFPNRGDATLQLFEALDAIVVAAQGRVYPAKDARMSSASFQAFYPAWQEFSRFVDPRFSSSFWRRVTGGAPLELAS